MSKLAHFLSILTPFIQNLFSNDFGMKLPHDGADELWREIFD